MTRIEAVVLTKQLLSQYNLNGWTVRLNTNVSSRFIGLCDTDNKTIILSAHHIDVHPTEEVEDTIRHEIAHALTPNDSNHGLEWKIKASEVGARPIACSGPSLPPSVIDAIRSGADVEMEIEEHVIRLPKYRVTRLQDKCPTCGKVAVSKRETLITSDDPTKSDEKYILLECGHLLIKKIPKGTPFHTITFDGEINCIHDWNKNECIKCGAHKPFNFQILGMQHLELALSVNKGGAVFDDMGLGKTIQYLGYLKFHPECFPACFVVKGKLKFQLFKEILRILGNDYLPQIIQTSDDWVIPNLKCYIIGYDMMVKKSKTLTKGRNKGKTITFGFDTSKFDKVGIKTLIIDETQHIKNPDSSRTQEVRLLSRDKMVIGTSGTPWKNRGSEFFTILNMLAPTKFNSYKSFCDRWVDYYEDPKTGKTKEGGIRNIPAFREYIKDIAIRREYDEVMDERPKINRTLHWTDLDKLAQSEYDEEMTRFVKWWQQIQMDGAENKFETQGSLIAKLNRLRHLTGLAKIPATLDICETFAEETDRKMTIFVHHQDVGDILYRKLIEDHLDISIFKLTSLQDDFEREKIVNEFNATDKCFLVASTLSSGEGLNLQTCSDVIMHERQWNPQNEDQAAPGRFRRIGMIAAAINIIFVTAAGTTDAHLGPLVERKRLAFHSSMNKSEVPTWNQNEIISELVDLLVKDHQKKMRK